MMEISKLPCFSEQFVPYSVFRHGARLVSPLVPRNPAAWPACDMDRLFVEDRDRRVELYLRKPDNPGAAVPASNHGAAAPNPIAL